MNNDQFWTKIIYVVSIAVSAAVAFLILGPRPQGIEGSLDVSMLPAVNATINGMTLILLVIGLMFYEKAYTLSVCLLSALIMLNISFSKSKLNGYFFSTYILISLIPFIIVNGILTGYLDLNTPPVWYNNAEIIGLRFLTIPRSGQSLTVAPSQPQWVKMMLTVFIFLMSPQSAPLRTVAPSQPQRV